MKVIIAGGGASGMMAAIQCARKGFETTIIELNENLGKKILATGNGKCNFTNSDLNITKYHSSDKQFVENVIDCFNYENTVTEFEKLGIFSTNKNGYYYPASLQASNVVNSLISALRILKVNIQTDTCITDIQINAKTNNKTDNDKINNAKTNNKTDNDKINNAKTDNTENKFKINTNRGSFFADKLIIACGSNAGISKDITWDIYKSINNKGHNFENFLPALCSLYLSENKLNKKFLKECKGVRSGIKASLFIENELKSIETGELQITDYGFSGIVIFQISALVSIALQANKKSNIKIDFLPEYSTEEIYCKFKNQEFYEKKNLFDLFSSLINNKLAESLLKRYSNIFEFDINKKNIGKENLLRIIDFMKNAEFEVAKTNDLKFAQVAAGGFDLSEIDSKTMESKLIEGLYFCGECLNVDGICGGYNLQWAWSTGYLAGKGVCND